ncbi:helix-turn-helix domain-containing protein [Streptomyces sp. NPDC093982]|uniref:helix-turn-helix domain-containing protein n=1 Tax=Streptomyces sp. NPDC093982 TaxID=3155077 RepID=UPI00341FC71C
MRNTILELLLKRAATVSELAATHDRPKSTVAHHVSVLVDAQLLKVVRTRRVRAIHERFYGRTPRIFRVGTVSPTDGDANAVLQQRSRHGRSRAAPAHLADQLSSIVRHVRIPQEQAREFWARLLELASDYVQLPRGGDVV